MIESQRLSNHPDGGVEEAVMAVKTEVVDESALVVEIKLLTRAPRAATA